MAYMPDEIILTRMMTALDLEFERALPYHNEGYESNNDYGLPTWMARSICVYSVFTTETSFNPADFTHSPQLPDLTPHSQTCQKPAILRMDLPAPNLQ